MWEYMSVEDGDMKKAIGKLNELGKQNWEAFGYTTFTGALGRGKHLILLKRQK
ncbi:hypothetical protein ES703_52515 [subsurface metagenome]